MPAKKEPAKKKEPTLRERATEVYNRVSTALNPQTYIGPAAQKKMGEAKEGYQERHRNRVDTAVDDAVQGRDPRTMRSSRRS